MTARPCIIGNRCSPASTCPLPAAAHPERMKSLSPGLRGTSYPGCATGCDLNPERIVSSVPCSNVVGATRTRRWLGQGGDATLTGLAGFSMVEPRVARASQPWADLSNPFGIAQSRQPREVFTGIEALAHGGSSNLSDAHEPKSCLPRHAWGGWLPDMDLNHDKQIQSLLCYRYTIGQLSARSLVTSVAESRLREGFVIRASERGSVKAWRKTGRTPYVVPTLLRSHAPTT
jgi:hypothetical protein